MARAKLVDRYSIGELQGLLRGQRLLLGELRRERKGLAKEMRTLDRRIRKLQGEGRRAAAKADAADKPRRKRRKLPKNDKPLHEYIKDALRTSKKGLRTNGIAEAVRAAGYKTNSKKFYGVVYTNVSKLVKEKHAVNEDGVFRAAGA